MSEKNQPMIIMPEDSNRTEGREAQRMNILAAKLVAETIRTTLGPKGMDKMLVDKAGNVTVTNDGVTILEEMDIQHPSAKMIVEVAKTQEDEVGDGTTTAVVLAGELLSNAEALLKRKIHPTVIAKGYRMAAEKALSILQNIAEEVSVKDKALLHKLAMTAMTGKGAESAKEHLASLVIRAALAVNNTNQGVKANREDVKIERHTGGSVEDTELIEGLVIDKERVHSSMPLRVQNARIALLDAPIEIKSTETDAKISITDPSKFQEFLDLEENMLKELVARIAAVGANVVACQKGIDDLVQHELGKHGILALRRVQKSDMERLAKATGGKIISNPKDLTIMSLGVAGLVEEVRVGEETMTFVRECKHARSVTILVKGGTAHITAEVERALEDALGDVLSALHSGRVVAGAGASEMELARNLRHFAQGLSGREQLAVHAFADAMEVIPKTLAENAGLDPIDMLVEVKAAHDKGQKWAGIDVFEGKVLDAWKAGVIEPLQIKTQAVSSAAEVAVMILRIDDVIAAEKSSSTNFEPPRDL